MLTFNAKCALKMHGESYQSPIINTSLEYSCVEHEQMQIVTEGLDAPLTRIENMKKLHERLQEDYSELLHNVSRCHLPAARKIMQKRYQ